MKVRITTGVVVLTTLFSISPTYAQTSDEVDQAVIEPNLAPNPGEQPGDRALMTRVILNNLTIWVRPRDGRRIYTGACRRLRHGCETQVAEFVEYIFEEAREQNFNPWLVAAIAWHESRFSPFAASSAGAYGILQILRRSPWASGLPFVRQRWYRQRCRRELGSCQRPIVERSIYWLKRSIAHCGSIQGGLRMYNSGRCNGPRSYPRAVFAYQRRFLAEAQAIRNNNFIDPARPTEGPVYVADDCAEPTLEELSCEQGSGPCNVVGIRPECAGILGDDDDPIGGIQHLD